MISVYTDPRAADQLTVSRAIHQAYLAGSTEPYDSYDDECYVCQQPGMLLLYGWRTLVRRTGLKTRRRPHARRLCTIAEN